VTAATDWDGPAERKHVRPGLESSFETLFHDTGIDRFVLRLDDPRLRPIETPRLQRAIGVIYRPETERSSHYFMTRLREQFDIIFHHDHTRAVEPLERTSLWVAGEAPETYPHGL
jgi:erythromycin esterase-like protein